MRYTRKQTTQQYFFSYTKRLPRLAHISDYSDILHTQFQRYTFFSRVTHIVFNAIDMKWFCYLYIDIFTIIQPFFLIFRQTFGDITSKLQHGFFSSWVHNHHISAEYHWQPRWRQLFSKKKNSEKNIFSLSLRSSRYDVKTKRTKLMILMYTVAGIVILCSLQLV